MLGGDKSSNSSAKPSSGKSTLFPTSGTGKSASYTSPSAYNTSKSNKTTFGIIWLPTRKHNKMKKEVVYNPHREDKRIRDRSPSMYNLMSGDSPDNLPHKKRDEEATLLMPERTKVPAPALPVSVVAPEQPHPEPAPSENPEEKQEFIQRDKNENKEAAGDGSDDKEEEKEFLENDDIETKKSPKGKTDENNLVKNKFSDKVDSVYLRPPPPHKARSNASTSTDEDGCGIKCLYYTLQCCDCVLM